MSISNAPPGSSPASFARKTGLLYRLSKMNAFNASARDCAPTMCWDTFFVNSVSPVHVARSAVIVVTTTKKINSGGRSNSMSMGDPDRNSEYTELAMVTPT